MSTLSGKALLVRNLSNLPGWRTRRKIVVLESDDWGSIRMPSRTVFEALQQQGVQMGGPGQPSYNLYDTLASSQDLTVLLELLSSFRDVTGRCAILTPVCLVANPDFERIAADGFHNYFYESFPATLQRYYPNQRVWELWNQGSAAGLLAPQFHGREHLNVAEWMRALQQGDRHTLLAFANQCWGFTRQSNSGHSVSFQAAYDFFDPSDLAIQERAIEEGLHLFHELWGFKARFFVPPNGPFNRRLERVAAQNGIRYLSTPKIQSEPLGEGRSAKVLHWLGQRNGEGQRYLIRNCFFEPWQGGNNWVDRCFKEIEIAFRWRKPAVISSHRVNYIGALDPANRKRGISQLAALLTRIVKRWPEVHFYSSAELGDFINASNHV